MKVKDGFGNYMTINEVMATLAHMDQKMTQRA